MHKAMNVILDAEVQRIFDSFSGCFGIRIGYFTCDGEELNAGLNQGRRPFCDLVRDRLYGAETCIRHDAMRCKEAFAKKSLHLYCCHAGATEGIYPVIVDDTPLGYVMIGQMRCDDMPAQKVRRDWNQSFSNDALIDAFRDLPHFDSERAEHVFKLFTVLADYIVAKNMVSLRGNLTVERALAYMRKRVHEKIALSEVAQHVCKSSSTVSHLFKTVTGKSFKSTMIEFKLEQADRMFAADPQLTVAEAAERLGYDNPFYFSRIYKKYRGFSPSRYRVRK